MKKKVKVKKINLILIMAVIVIIGIGIILAVMNIKKNNESNENINQQNASNNNSKANGEIKGGTKTFKYKSANYTITGNAATDGKAQDDAKIFKATYTIANIPEEGSNTKYSISYVDLTEANVRDYLPAIDDYSDIEINGKKFKYQVDGLNNQIDLIYLVDDNCYLFIKINALVENKEGEENPYVIGVDVIEAEETKAMVNFEIKK